MAEIVSAVNRPKCSQSVTENILDTNALPQSGLSDTLTRTESEIVTNTSPQSGLSDTLTRTESMTFTN